MYDVQPAVIECALCTLFQLRQSQELDVEVASMIEMAETASASGTPATSHKQMVSLLAPLPYYYNTAPLINVTCR